MTTEASLRSFPRQRNRNTVALSVVIPVRDSSASIRACIDSLLEQSVAEIEVIVVGNRDDNSWPALADIHDPRLVRIGVEIERRGNRRDANLKRSIGLQHARGRALALSDSDMTLPGDWAAKGLSLLEEHAVVGGGMISETSDFLGGYVDRNAMYAKTPRIAGDYTLSASNFGKRGCKPPITASLFLRREVYERVGGPDPAFTNSYEDYEWARRMVDADYPIRITNRVTGVHRHRTETKALLNEYHRSGAGASDYISRFGHCHLARSRRQQVVAVGTLWVALVLGLAWVPQFTLLTGALITLTLSVLSMIRVRRIEAAVYPLITLILGLYFWRGLIGGLLEGPRPRAKALEVRQIPPAREQFDSPPSTQQRTAVIRSTAMKGEAR